MAMKIIYIMLALSAIVEESSSVIDRPRRTEGIRKNLECGIMNSDSGLIVRGRTFPRGTYPWIVALVHTGYSPPKYFCGATLISATFVISAAHCILQKHEERAFLPREILALFGVHDLTLNELRSIRLSPKKIFIHDDWNHFRPSYDADISLLEFDEGQIHFSTYVRPICLWPSLLGPPVIEAIITGWGQSEDPTTAHENKPRMIKVRMQSNEKCFLDTKGLVELSSSRTICAGTQNNSSGVCRGDSGGGLFVKIDDVYYLRGIVSSSLLKEDNCDVSKDAIYTNVLMFTEWIATVTRDIREIVCTYENVRSSFFNAHLESCIIRKAIASDVYILASKFNSTIEFFDISGNRQVKYLPSKIGEKFPNLKEYCAMQCGLTIVRKHYFKDMWKVQHLDLSFNNIATIETEAFDDLVSLKRLSLHFNMIETLGENVFVKLVNLETLYIDLNKIRYQSPETFRTSSGKIMEIHDWESDASKFGKSFNNLLGTRITSNLSKNGMELLLRKYNDLDMFLD